MQPTELVFGMQHCFNPTRWNIKDDIKFFKRKMTSFFLKMEDDLSFFTMEDDLKYLKIEDDLNKYI
jgi:hypothetical protein